MKANQVRRLGNLYRRKTPPTHLISPELAKTICRLSAEMRRQIGLLIDRQGRTAYVVVGTYQGIVIPNLDKYRTGGQRLKGLRCVHTHLKREPLSHDDLMDLSFLRLDLMAAVTIQPTGDPGEIHMAHLLPEGSGGESWEVFSPRRPGDLDIDCLGLIRSLESEFASGLPVQRVRRGGERAIVVSVSTRPRRETAASTDELKQLAHTCGILAVETVIQRRRRVNPGFLMGRGKLSELVVLALRKGADLLIFDQELNPSQVRSITDHTDLKVIDRTQLILDIFAQRAQSREGKIQVELAQLKYMLPRLVGKGTAMSRLTGGIGGRGPGETQLEVDRRRVRKRIAQLERSLVSIAKQRDQRRARRNKKALPIISIVGYTNAGKSTLLNTLTGSSVLVESKLFATLDPTSRRKRLPKEAEIIITDTVGFINDLPKELMTAFRATLEELNDADLLIHLIDISNPGFPRQIEAVESILGRLRLDRIPILRVFNKKDRLDDVAVRRLCRKWDCMAVSARDKETLGSLLGRIEGQVGQS